MSLDAVEALFAKRGWQPFPFQREVWQAYLAGESGLVHSATGTGKTLAAVLGPLADAGEPGTLRLLWLTPLRALAQDTALALQDAVQALGLDWRVELRTGDTSSHAKQRQTKKPPEILVTTPESLSLLLTREDASLLAGVQCVVCDEWHELLGSKRGVQTELALARLRRWNPALRTWGLSATLGNLDVALAALLGPGRPGRLVRGDVAKEIVIETLLPPRMERFPWAGHLGTRMIGPVCKALAESQSCLVFCNTRAQTEIWFQGILAQRPDWKGKIELHHGSLDRDFREAVEAGLKAGVLRAVVCTSSLDLGVDFTPVDTVIQVGSPKGVARLLQRAGRSGHRPGVPSRVLCVPTHALELVDIAAARAGYRASAIEGREPAELALDVLAQHLVTVALGGGYQPDDLYQEVTQTYSYRDLSREDFERVHRFVVHGGEALSAYPQFQRVVEVEGVFRVPEKAVAQRHRLSIGTIVSDAAMQVRYQSGAVVGTVEESFLTRLKKGDRFVFGGKALEFLRFKDMAAIVKPASSVKGAIPRWAGGRLPLSSELAAQIRRLLDLAVDGEFPEPEMQAIAPLLRVQAEWSALPRENEVLVERLRTREGHHLFFYPIEGRLVHEGLAALFAWRIARVAPITFTLACNDYGFELLSTEPAPLEEAIADGLFSGTRLLEHILESLNSVEMAKRQFREIARVAGLVTQGLPGRQKTAKQVQASSGLLFDVFSRYDPENILLHQAQREVLERQLEQGRLSRALARLRKSRLLVTDPPEPTPMAFPILVDRLRETVTSESLGDRIERMAQRLESLAD